jgi:hypothetical protein
VVESMQSASTSNSPSQLKQKAQPLLQMSTFRHFEPSIQIWSH